MPSPTDARPDPGPRPGIEARLRAELGEASLPDEVRQRHLTRLHALAAELGPPASADGNGTGHEAADHATPATVLGHTRPFRVDRDAILSDQDGQTAGDEGAAATVPDFSHTPDQGSGPAGERARRRWFASTTPRVAAASVAAFAVMVAGGGSAVAASTDALPGEALHYVKRAVEQVQVAAAWSDSSEVEAHLGVAEARLEEALRLAAGDGDLSELPTTLARHEAALDAATEQAGDDSALVASVNESTERAAARLADLVEELPDTAAPQARDALQRAGERLEQRLPAERDDDGNAPDTTDAPGGDRSGPDSRGGDQDLTPPARDSGQGPADAPGHDRRPGGSGNSEEPAQPDSGDGANEGRAPEDAARPDDAGQPDDAAPRNGGQADRGQADGGQADGGQADGGQPDDTGQPGGANEPDTGAGQEDPGELNGETPDNGGASDSPASPDDGTQQQEAETPDSPTTSSGQQSDEPRGTDTGKPGTASQSETGGSDQTDSTGSDDDVDRASNDASSSDTDGAGPSDENEPGDTP